MGKIRPLPTALVNQIAAGEVIERPASVVKELLENAIDAHARNIRIEVEEGGRKLIRVSDDGEGIATEDLPLAFASHATSKLSSPEDLERINTLGFRGEALASIGAVSQARLISRQRGQTAGAEISVVGGRIGEVRPAGAPEGTIVEVRRLFFNAPVRRRFLKKTTTEFAHIAEVVTRIALANAAVRFTLLHNGKTVFDLPAVDDLRERLAMLFGRDLVQHLGQIHLLERDLAIDGFAAPPHQSRPDTSMQYVFINGRYIRDRTISHAIREAYRGLVETGRRPMVFLYLSLDPRTFDVNIHPMKIEVRFSDPQRIHHLVRSALRNWLMKTDTLKPLEISQGETPPPTGERIERVREAIADYLKHLPPAATPKRLDRGEQREDISSTVSPPRPSPPPRTIPRRKIPVPHQVDLFSAVDKTPSPAAPTLAPGNLFQLFDTYLVLGTEEGLLIIDQHALHERMLQERIQRRLRKAPLESQRLLMPVMVDLSPAEFSLLEEVQPMLQRLGIEVEPFGGTTVAVRTFPVLLERADPASLVHDLLAAAATGAKPDQDALLERMVNLMACRGAIKAGQRLSQEEMRDLAREASGLGQRDTCPHGRPTVLRLTKADLERQFRRS